MFEGKVSWRFLWVQLALLSPFLVGEIRFPVSKIDKTEFPPWNPKFPLNVVSGLMENRSFPLLK